MLKRTNKITANKAVINKLESGEVVIDLFDKDECLMKSMPIEEFVEDFIGKSYVNINISYDEQM